MKRNRNRDASHSLPTAAALLCAGLVTLNTGCGAPSEQHQKAEDEAGGAAAEALIGGTLISDPSYTGIVKLRWDDWICSGVLMSNAHVLTAKHCVQHNRPTFVVMGAEVTLVANKVHHPTKDLSLLRVNGPFLMWSNGVLSRTGYFRSYDTRSYEQLVEQQFVCAGYGHETTRTTGPTGNLRVELMKSVGSPWYSNARLYPHLMWFKRASDGADVLAEGDSGGPCLNWFSLDSSAVTSIHYSQTFYSDSTAGTLIGSEEAYWIALAMLSMP